MNIWTRRSLVAAAMFVGMAANAAFARTPLTIQLNWTAGGTNAGFASAAGEGYYKAAGLDVTIAQGNGSSNTAQLVASGRAQVAYADAVAVAQMIGKGAPMKIISTIYQSNPNGVNALKKMGIKSVADLKGKKVGVPAGGSQGPMLPLLLKANGLKESDMQLMNMPAAAMVPSLLQGQVDVILGAADAYQIQLEMQGAELDVLPFADNGVPTVSTSMFASNDFIKQNPEVLKKFVAASLKGWSYAIDNPDKAIQHVKKLFPDLNEKMALAELKAIIPLFCKADAKFIGKAEDAHWARTQTLMAEVKLLPEGQDPKSYYTNEFLPAESEMKPCR